MKISKILVVLSFVTVVFFASTSKAEFGNPWMFGGGGFSGYGMQFGGFNGFNGFGMGYPAMGMGFNNGFMVNNFGFNSGFAVNSGFGFNPGFVDPFIYGGGWRGGVVVAGGVYGGGFRRRCCWIKRDGKMVRASDSEVDQIVETSRARRLDDSSFESGEPVSTARRNRAYRLSDSSSQSASFSRAVRSAGATETRSGRNGGYNAAR